MGLIEICRTLHSVKKKKKKKKKKKGIKSTLFDKQAFEFYSTNEQNYGQEWSVNGQ